MTKTILVADDSKTIQKVVTLTFRATDFRVISASDADEALKRVSESRPDVVLADVTMPGKNGYDLCSQLKGAPATSNIPVLLLAGAFEPFDDRRAAEARADGHIKKPFDSQALIDRVRSLTGAQVGSEMPMSFAASLAARQRGTEETAHAGANSSGAHASPSFAQGAFGPSTNPAMHAAASANASAGAGASASRSAPQAAYARAGAGAGGGQSNIAADLGVPASPPTSPFGPPRTDGRPKIEARAARPEEVMIEEPDIIEDAEVVDDAESQGMTVESTVPSLEPPPSPSEVRARANVDMWALADEPDRRGVRSEQITREVSPQSIANIYAEARAAEDARTQSDDGIEAIEEAPVDEIPDDARAREFTHDTARAVSAAAAGPIANAAGDALPGMPKDQLVSIARDVIERIAWEVVPDLAETIIRAEINRLLKERGL
jgi:CheY-like chemotaxis protein